MTYFGSRDALTFVKSPDLNEMLHSTTFHQNITILRRKSLVSTDTVCNNFASQS